MTRARVLQEVRQMRFEELYERRQQRSLTMAEAGAMLGVTERTFRRWSGRYHAEGAEGLQDRRIGRLSTTKRGRESFLMILSHAREAASCTPSRIASPSGVPRLPRRRGGPVVHSASVKKRLQTI